MHFISTYIVPQGSGNDNWHFSLNFCDMLPISGKVVYNSHIVNLQMDKLRFLAPKARAFPRGEGAPVRTLGRMRDGVQYDIVRE